MSNVYLIIESGGSWEDHYTRPIKAYLNKSQAEQEILKLNTDLKQRQDLQNEIAREITEIDCNHTKCEHCKFYVEPDFDEDCCLGYDYSYNLEEQHPYRIEEVELVE